MKTVNSISGGKTSAYIAAKYPAEYNLFSLVRTNDKKCLYPDKKVRQIVSDKIGVEFIGTLEEDAIIHTMLDLEQFIGYKINWVTGKPFEEILQRGKKLYLPNVTQRFCTTELKLQPMFDWWHENINEVVEMRIGFRANEKSRAKTMLSKTNKKGNLTFKTIVGKRKTQNKWADIEWQHPTFPLIDDNIFRDTIDQYWKDKPVRFAYMNNCVGCFHRTPVLLKHMSNLHENKFDWFASKEQIGYQSRTFKKGMTYEQIKKHKLQLELSLDDFSDCDNGYCGI